MDGSSIRHGRLFRCGEDGVAYIRESGSEKIYVVKARHFGTTTSRFSSLGLADGMAVLFRVGPDGRVSEAGREALREAALGG